MTQVTYVLSDSDMKRYFSGEELYGDHFGPLEIAHWYQMEREASAAGTHGWKRNCRSYDSHYVNWHHLFRFLPCGRFDHILGFGAGYGAELMPFFGRAGRVTVVEASESYGVNDIDGQPIMRVRPSPSGDLPFDDGSFDLITSLSVLHHIPNVSHVVAEMSRCLKPGGYLAVREPIVSMGDWRKPRGRLTPCERGIPARLLSQYIRDAGLDVMTSQQWGFSLSEPISKFLRKGMTPWNSRPWVMLDTFLSLLFRWNYRYHATSVLGKLRPTCICVLARKSSGSTNPTAVV